MLEHCQRISSSETSGAMSAGFDHYNEVHSHARFKLVMREAMDRIAANMGRPVDSPGKHR